VPTGGTARQILHKVSGTDYDTAWVDRDAEYSLTDASTVAINWNNGNAQYLEAMAGDRTLTFANPVNGAFYSLRLKSSGGSRTPTFPTVTWLVGSAPGAVASGKNLIVGLWRSNGVYYGVYKVEA
jgi:hypothetical protein